MTTLCEYIIWATTLERQSRTAGTLLPTILSTLLFPFLSFPHHLCSHLGPLCPLVEEDRNCVPSISTWIACSSGTAPASSIFMGDEQKPSPGWGSGSLVGGLGPWQRPEWVSMPRSWHWFDLVEHISTTNATHAHLQHVSASQITTKPTGTSHHLQTNCSPRELVIPGETWQGSD